MSTSASRPLSRATAADLLAIPEDQRFHEVIDGELVRKATPTGEHGGTQAALTGSLFEPFNRRPGGRRPGGWWFLTEVEIELEPVEVYRPDILGFRRERVAERPRGNPLRVRPDWVCEVLSPTNMRNDTIKKMRVYQRCEIPHYWIVDPKEETLTVYRWTVEGYLAVLLAERGERVKAEPFGAIELSVGVLFGDDADE
jgi:Uma2 family endonuclease